LVSVCSCLLISPQTFIVMIEAIDAQSHFGLHTSTVDHATPVRKTSRNILSGLVVFPLSKGLAKTSFWCARSSTGESGCQGQSFGSLHAFCAGAGAISGIFLDRFRKRTLQKGTFVSVCGGVAVWEVVREGESVLGRSDFGLGMGGAGTYLGIGCPVDDEAGRAAFDAVVEKVERQSWRCIGSNPRRIYAPDKAGFQHLARDPEARDPASHRVKPSLTLMAESRTSRSCRGSCHRLEAVLLMTERPKGDGASVTQLTVDRTWVPDECGH
jgi:hypothetical protein